MVLILALPVLIVRGVLAHMLFGRHELVLERKVGRHTEGIEIAKVKLSALFVAQAVCAASKGEVRIQPSVGLHIELSPVVAVNGVGGCEKSRLPPGGDSAAAAQGDEQDRLYPAVTLLIDGGIFRNVHNGAVPPDKGVAHMAGEIVVDQLGLADRIGFVTYDLLTQ